MQVVCKGKEHIVGSIGTDGVNGSKLERMITMKGYGEVNERVDACR